MKENLQSLIDKNRIAWNAKTPFHLKSEFYRQESFLKGQCSLNSIELELMGNLVGKEVLHLQCHFGQDTLSLQRRGALATGVDFSEVAIQIAKETAEQLELPVDFVCSDIYRLPDILQKQYDLVFTSYGVLGWLPDLNRWAEVVHALLKPGGQFLIVEFHPFIWTFDDHFKKIAYDYFNTQPYLETYSGTYADRTAPIICETAFWNHSLGEVFESLLSKGMEVKLFREYDYSPYPCFPEVTEFEHGKFRIKGVDHLIPMIYALQMVKK
jgi:SAM-dependent methyltransferase